MDYKLWKQTKIDYESITIKSVLQLLFNEIIYFINRCPELYYKYELSTFQSRFNHFIYTNYHIQKYSINTIDDPELYDYFSMKFSEDIVDIFLLFKEVSQSYNLSLFHKSNDTSFLLENFLFEHVYIEDPYYSDDELTDKEENIGNTIYEPDL